MYLQKTTGQWKRRGIDSSKSLPICFEYKKPVLFAGFQISLYRNTLFVCCFCSRQWKRHIGWTSEKVWCWERHCNLVFRWKVPRNWQMVECSTSSGVRWFRWSLFHWCRYRRNTSNHLPFIWLLRKSSLDWLLRWFYLFRRRRRKWWSWLDNRRKYLPSKSSNDNLLLARPFLFALFSFGKRRKMLHI